MRTSILFVVVAAIMPHPHLLTACEPGGASLGNKAFATGGALGGKVGGIAPAFAPAPMFAGALGDPYAAQKQQWAQQAAIRWAQKQPIRLTKAYQARQEMLAQRAAQRELIAQRYQDYRRRKGLETPLEFAGPQVASLETAAR